MYTVSFVAAYLVLGFLASLLLRRGRPQEDLEESLLASVVALPLVITLAAAVLAHRAWLLLAGRTGPTARV